MRESWRTLLKAAIEHAGEWLGFGAKSAEDYGRLEQDPSERTRRESEREQQRQAADAEAARLARERLPAGARLLTELDAQFDKQPKDPRERKLIVQPTSSQYWQPVRDLLTKWVDGVTLCQRQNAKHSQSNPRPGLRDISRSRAKPIRR